MNTDIFTLHRTIEHRIKMIKNMKDYLYIHTFPIGLIFQFNRIFRIIIIINVVLLVNFVHTFLCKVYLVVCIIITAIITAYVFDVRLKMNICVCLFCVDYYY